MLTFTGEHDLATRDAIGSLLASLVDENRLVVVDFSTARFVDTSIVVAVRESGRAARQRGSLFRLQLATASIVRMIFTVSGALDELDCVSTRQEGLKEPPTPDASTEDSDQAASRG